MRSAARADVAQVKGSQKETDEGIGWGNRRGGGC
jgi:hypothetical protein